LGRQAKPRFGRSLTLPAEGPDCPSSDVIPHRRPFNIENEDENDWGTRKRRQLKGKRIRINEVPLDYSAELGRLTGNKERGYCLREAMPKYLTMVSYTPEGIKGLVKEGGTARRAAVEKMLEKLGGRLEGFYFAFGDNNAYVISEGPDNATAAAISLAITTGAIRTKTVVLLSPEEVDLAFGLPVEYPPPGK
jgi:uncharacterized protein with GYD domain